MYIAEGDKVYYCHPNELGTQELFLTVHQTKDTTKTVEEQARVIAFTLNHMGRTETAQNIR